MSADPHAEPGAGGVAFPVDQSPSDDVVRQFVEHWGMMARAWGINATMGELFALLYVTGSDWTADALREWLRISRGNVSMNLRELMAWGVVHKIHRQGERREYYRAESNVWTLFRRILTERKRRELDPTLGLLDRTFELVRQDSERGVVLERITALRQFFGLINSLSTRLLTLEPGDLDELAQLVGDEDKPTAAETDGEG
jgi:DNA-binding transcriptional regulator GbsR (MarR family)